MLLLTLSAQASDLRIVGTNLYDFSGVDEKSSFRIRGKVVKLFPKSAEISVPNGVGYQRYLFAAPSGLIRPNDLLGMKADKTESVQRGVAAVAAMDRSGAYSNYFNPPPITQAQYYTLDAEMRKNYKPVQLYRSVYLLNYPSAFVEGQEVNCAAVPDKNRGFFDCGSPFIGNTNDYRLTYVVTQRRIQVRTNALANTSSTNLAPSSPIGE